MREPGRAASPTDDSAQRRAAQDGNRVPAERDGGGVSGRVKVLVAIVAALLVGWFLVAWLILDRHFLDAAGESVGTAFLLGIVVSLVGAVRGSR